ncbi:MAG: hypothetical protein R2880_04730 [Deinococcales bacterium]
MQQLFLKPSLIFICLSFASAQESQPGWFMGTWEAHHGLDTYTLVNRSDGSYSFSISGFGSNYQEEGSYSLGPNRLTQSWFDAQKGQQEVTYKLEKLSDSHFLQSGGNLGDTVFVFNKLSGIEMLGEAPPTTLEENPSQAPAARVNPAISRDWLLGPWLARNQGQYYFMDIKADSFNFEIQNAQGVSTYQQRASWQLADNILTQTWQDNTGNHVAPLNLERVSEDGFRMVGGNLNLSSLLFYRLDRANPKRISPEQSWLLGKWDTIIGLESSQLSLEPEGFSLTRIDPFSQEKKLEQGTWSFAKGILSLKGDTERSYQLDSYSDLAFNLKGADLGDGVYFSRASEALYDPLKRLSFEGQYTRQDETLNLNFAEGRYQGSLLSQDQRYQVTGKAQGDSLTLMVAAPEAYTMTLRLDNNRLEQQGQFLLNTRYQKLSETYLAISADLAGVWVKVENLNQDDRLELFNNGQYVQTNYIDISGSASVFKTRGLYEAQGDKLVLDPECSSPSSYQMQRIDNHLLLSSPGILDDRPVISTYMATPESSFSYAQNEQASYERALADESRYWQQQIPRGLVNPSLPRPSSSEQISLDPNPSDIFRGASVFAEREVYPHLSEYYYAYDRYGNLRTTSINMQIINPGQAQEFDIGRGEYYDKQFFYFFPNGRTMTYLETYFDAVSVGYPPTPNKQFIWGRYRIEGDKLIVSIAAHEENSEENPEENHYDLLYGGSVLRLDEACFDNLKRAER